MPQGLQQKEPLYVELYSISQRLRGLAHLFAAYSEPSVAVESIEEILAGISSLIEEEGEGIWKIAQEVEELTSEESLA